MRKKSEFKVHQITISEMRGGMVKAVVTENGREVLSVKFDAKNWSVTSAFSKVFSSMAAGAVNGAHDFDIPF